MVVATVAVSDLCVNDQVTELLSPNGKLKAVSFRRDCGATTAYGTHVSILPASQRLPNDGGNVFIVGGEPIVVMRWIDDSRLSISGGGEAKPFLHEISFRGVQVIYE